MNHPEIVVVPLLMFTDYILTVWGAKESFAVYRNHFALETYELNPLWRKSVDEIRWFNPRHFALVCIVTALLVILDYNAPTELPLELGLGMLFGAWGMLCGRHLTNLLTFRFLNRHPQEISGKVNLSILFTLKLSQYTYVGVAPLFAVIACINPNQYTIGIALGVTVLAGVHSLWARKHSTSSQELENATTREA